MTKILWTVQTICTFYLIFYREPLVPSSYIKQWLIPSCTRVYTCCEVLHCAEKPQANEAENIYLFCVKWGKTTVPNNSFFSSFSRSPSQSSMTVTQSPQSCLLLAAINQLIHSALECNIMLTATCLLSDPLPNVTLILNDNADVTVPMCGIYTSQLELCMYEKNEIKFSELRS